MIKKSSILLDTNWDVFSVLHSNLLQCGQKHLFVLMLLVPFCLGECVFWNVVGAFGGNNRVTMQVSPRDLSKFCKLLFFKIRL